MCSVLAIAEASVCLSVCRVVRSCRCHCFKPSVFYCSTTLKSICFKTYRMPQKLVCTQQC